jgi:hypothetical protein
MTPVNAAVTADYTTAKHQVARTLLQHCRGSAVHQVVDHGGHLSSRLKLQPGVAEAYGMPAT